jgi:TRAP-type C4-dicarboxylate transport system permease small subunit
MDALRKLYKFLCKAEELVTGVGFVALIFLVFMSAILRMFHVSMSWNIDLAMLLLAWTAFLGADCAYRGGQLLGIDIVTRNLPKKAKKAVELLVHVIVGCGLVIIAFFGIKLANSEWTRTYQSMPIPYSIVTLSMPLAAASMVISTIRKIRNCVRTFNE